VTRGGARGLLAVVLLSGCGGSTAPTTLPPLPPLPPLPGASESMPQAPLPAPASSPPTPGAAAASPATPGAPYRNTRFGFQAEVPAGFTAASPGPTNGDGAVFRDGSADYIVSARLNVEATSAARELASLRASLAGRQRRITYTSSSGGVVAVSGIDASTGTSTIFYVREVVGPSTVSTLSWTYPQARDATYKPLLEATVRTFVPAP
jgi:hypothetical protein